MPTQRFITQDQSKTLFPNKTNQFLLENGGDLVRDHIAKCFEKSEPAFSFLPQQRVYAAKQGPNLRRTVKLDPVAEYYIYDVVYRQRTRFRKPHQESRTHFGYRFQNGQFLNPSSSYKGFRTAISKYTKKYRYFISFDVASY